MQIRKKRFSFRNYAVASLIVLAGSLSQANIKDYSGDMIAVGFGVGQDRLSPKLTAENGNTVEFEPNLDAFTKLSFEYDWFAFAFNIHKTEKDRKFFGSSEFDDYQFRIYRDRYLIDVFYQKYQGFYINNSPQVVGTSTPFLAENLESQKYSLAVTYTFNDDFSLNHVYANDKMQTKSAGSWLLQASYNHADLDNGNNTIIPSASANNYQLLQSLEAAKFDSFAFGGGYSYTLIYSHLFLNGTVIFLPNIKHKRFRFSLSADKETELDSLNGTVKLAAGWNSPKVKFHLEINVDSASTRLDDDSTVEIGTFSTGFLLHYRNFF